MFTQNPYPQKTHIILRLVGPKTLFYKVLGFFLIRLMIEILHYLLGP